MGFFYISSDWRFFVTVLYFEECSNCRRSLWRLLAAATMVEIPTPEKYIKVTTLTRICQQEHRLKLYVDNVGRVQVSGWSPGVLSPRSSRCRSQA